jgi:phosphomannomutase
VFTETLTGFKHMGNESDRLIKNGETVLFAFEEAIGFMCGSAVLDKVSGFSVYVYICISKTSFKKFERRINLARAKRTDKVEIMRKKTN